jgi:hypothetical protein
MNGEERRDPIVLPVLPGERPSTRPEGLLPMDRRQALKVMAIAAAGPTLAACAPGEEPTDATVPAPGGNPRAAGTAWDPDLVAPVVPWERTLTPDELAGLAVLCDVILPADERSPSASAVGAHDFIDEWVSAPYEGNEHDLVVIRGGLVWLDREANERFGAGGTPLRFRGLTAAQRTAICDDICYEPNAPNGYEAGAKFFDRVRYLTSTAFWTTTEGMQDLEYIGNIPLAQWDLPPAEVLRHIGLEQAP